MNTCQEVISRLIDKIELNEQNDYIKELSITKCILTKKVEHINKIIEIGKLNLFKMCGNSSEGHDFITEIEANIYGDTWYICSKCGYTY
tara:strand:- start:395 stop:661 length:267 start_codon:yes stop_codon:yes gene_type:complete